MSNLVKRLLVVVAIGVAGAIGIFMLRQIYGAPPDNYQNGTPPLSEHAKPDKKLSPEEMKKRMDSLPGAKAG